MIRTLLVVFIVFGAVSLGISQKIEEKWTTLKNVEPSSRYDDIFFLNADTGWAASGGLGSIYRTNNGGLSWIEQENYDVYLRSIEFFDKNVGLCGGVDGTFYRTTNGGATWTDIAPTITPQPPGICGLAKADDNTIYGVGVWFEPAYVVKSVDRGENWTHIDMSEYATSLIDAYFFDADHGFVVGSNGDEIGGVVLYTADGGQTWEEKFRTEHVGDRIWKIQSPDGKHFFGSIETWTGNTRMIKSNDKGQTWEMLQVDPGFYNIQSVGFMDSLHGWTGGSQQLFETKDGGATWKKITLGGAYNRFQKINDSLAFQTGQTIYRFTKKTIPLIITSASAEPAPYDPVHYVTVSPNPTSRKADIHVNFGLPTMAQIYICSTTGQDLTKLFQGRVPKGEKTFPIDVSSLKAQTYLILVKTHEGLVSTKLVKLPDTNGR